VADLTKRVKTNVFTDRRDDNQGTAIGRVRRSVRPSIDTLGLVTQLTRDHSSPGLKVKVISQSQVRVTCMIRYDMRCYNNFNVRLKADMSQLNLPHRTNN